MLIPQVYTSQGNFVKKEFVACAVGMDLPPNHKLRTELSEKKDMLEAQLEKLPSIIRKQDAYLNIFNVKYVQSNSQPVHVSHVCRIRPIPHVQTRLKNCTDDELAEVAKACNDEAPQLL